MHDEVKVSDRRVLLTVTIDEAMVTGAGCDCCAKQPSGEPERMISSTFSWAEDMAGNTEEQGWVLLAAQKAVEARMRSLLH